MSNSVAKKKRSYRRSIPKKRKSNIRCIDSKERKIIEKETTLLNDLKEIIKHTEDIDSCAKELMEEYTLG